MSSHDHPEQPYGDDSSGDFRGGGAHRPNRRQWPRRGVGTARRSAAAPPASSGQKAAAILLALLSWVALIVGIGLWLSQNRGGGIALWVVAGVVGLIGLTSPGTSNLSAAAASTSMVVAFRLLLFVLALIVVVAIGQAIIGGIVDGVKTNAGF